jgi:hypothetical protein
VQYSAVTINVDQFKLFGEQQVFIVDAGERRRLLWNAFYIVLWKELLLLAADVMLC